MIKFFDYLVLESANDLNPHLFDYPDRTRIAYGVVHHGGDRENYPQYYKYEEPYDNHFCGDWWKCDKKEVIKAIGKEIEELNSFKEKIKNLTDYNKDDKIDLSNEREVF